ncbi:MAG: carboxymuconolactone decarboxylase family protein [Acidimicrobiia bacterium]|nr:carboxymuconolactone decarboxylase family protein [Acidimicrobiia bacterium]
MDWAIEKARERVKSSPANAVNVSATLANSKVLGKIIAGSAGVVMGASNTEPRLREIVILRMGWNCQSVYEFGQHQMFGRSVGLGDAEIYAVTRPLSQGRWGPAEAALLQMVDDLHADDCVSDATWADLCGHFEPSLVMEYVGAAMSYRMVSAILNTCGVQLDEGVPTWPTAPAGG